MGFTDAIGAALRRYAEFDGRATRPEFWWYVLFYVLVQRAGGVLDAALFPNAVYGVLGNIAALALLLPTVAVTTRRLHDIDRSGWWQLVGLIPVVGVFVLIWLCAQRGTEGPNRFGAPPASAPGRDTFVP